MKKVFYAMFCMSAVFAVSCTKGFEPEGPKMIKVSFEDAETKSIIDGEKVRWEVNDAIMIYDGSKQNGFAYNAETGSFDGAITEGATDFYALYPELVLRSDRVSTTIMTSSSESETTFTTFLPSYQKVRPNSVSQGAMITACKPVLNGDKLSGSMKTLNGFLKFTIADAENSKIAKVRFTAGSKYMSGRCKVIFNADGVSISTDASVCENTYVECGPESGNYLQNGTYYVSVLPYNYSGLTITLVTTSGKVYEYATEGWVKPQPNTVQYVGIVDAGLASDNGLSSKTSVLVDFTATTNVTNLVKDGGNATISANGTSYIVATNALYAKNNAGYFQNGYFQTPAIENKTLKEVIVTFEGALDSNNKFKIDISEKSDRSGNELTGLYYGSNSVSGGSGTTYAFPMLGTSERLYWSHKFVLGKVSNGETSQSKVNPNANTSYYLANRQATCQLSYIELIYE
jgi:hypothetical protein